MARVSDGKLLEGLSHELRAPLQALLGYVDLLRDGTLGPLTAEQGDAVERIASGAEKILAVARDVLHAARLDAGKEQPRAAPVDLAALVKREVEDGRALAARRGLKLIVEAEPLHVVTDGAKVARVLANLLSNALRYTEKGTVRVAARAAGDGFAITVADTGPGIPADDVGSIFEEYVRLATTPGGTGLGLPIARRLALLLGGEIQLQTEPGRGSAFTLLVPRGS